jgi:alkylation response protein AidB-like acyl-CoA dehydrogenase
MVGASAIGWIAAFLDDAAIDEIFAGGRAPAAAVVVYPAGIATPCGDGYRVTGRWAFASGVRHADWIVLGVRVQHRSHDPRGHRMVVVPASAVSISDDWHAVGLAGTGSCGVSLIDGDVPASFTWDFTYGRPYRGGPLYRLGWPGFVAHEPAAFAVGVAYRALDALVEQTSRSAAPASARIEYSLGAAELRLRGARALVRELCDAAWDAAVRTDAVPDTLQAEMRAAAASTTDAAMDVIVQAYRAAGGAAVYRASVLQRCLRDLSAAGQHWLASDAAYETYGHHLLRRSEHGTDHGLGRRHHDRPGAGA